MTKLTTLTMGAIVAVAAYAPSNPVLAAADAHLNWGQELHASDDACPSGKKILNVTRKIVNAVDSGTGINQYGVVWWADSKYNQNIQVVETAPDTFCATVTSKGKFTSVGGNSPGCSSTATCTNPAQDQLDAGVMGTFEGGLINTFTGTFDPGDMRTRGSIGTLDGDCNAATAGGCLAPVFSAWRSEFFTDVDDSSLSWWGWVYHAGKNGTWVNSSDGNEGDITSD